MRVIVLTFSILLSPAITMSQGFSSLVELVLNTVYCSAVTLRRMDLLLPLMYRCFGDKTHALQHQNGVSGNSRAKKVAQMVKRLSRPALAFISVGIYMRGR